MNTNSNYILITPVKDEEKNLPDLIQSVIRQKILPRLWVIVNDGSLDNSPKIINNASKKILWIKMVDLPLRDRDIGLGYSYVCNIGFDYAFKHCKRFRIDYEFIGLLDADILLGSNYFEGLINYFNKDQKLGIASGMIWSFNGKKYILEKGRLDEPRGAARLWRKKCFHDCEGYLKTYAPDTVSNIKARMKGWKTKCYTDIRAKQIRMTSEAEGLWMGFIKKGETDYFIRKNIIYIMLRSITFLTQKKFYLSFAYFLGYMNCYINKKEHLLDQDVIKYHKDKHLLKVILSIIKK